MRQPRAFHDVCDPDAVIASLVDGARAQLRDARFDLQPLAIVLIVLIVPMCLLATQDQLQANRADAARAAVGTFRVLGGGWQVRDFAAKASRADVAAASGQAGGG